MKVCTLSAKKLHVQIFLSAGKIAKRHSLSVANNALVAAISATSILVSLDRSIAMNHDALLNQFSRWSFATPLSPVLHAMISMMKALGSTPKLFASYTNSIRALALKCWRQISVDIRNYSIKSLKLALKYLHTMLRQSLVFSSRSAQHLPMSAHSMLFRRHAILA
ncbi:unannotated protein [freshwater metagenome]|uniref:Unannotated protein n=1 Tax=freshwater metagenome TaxID=449393 RepID=A0A6J7IW63_9ZZZZ